MATRPSGDVYNVAYEEVAAAVAAALKADKLIALDDARGLQTTTANCLRR